MEDNIDQYIPGIRNIGLQEVSIRKKFIWFFLPLTVLFSILCLYYCHSMTLWLLLVASSFSLIVIILAIRYQFCILFGFFSLYNFQCLGNLHEVKKQENIRKDRRRVLEILLLSTVLTLAFSTGIHLLAKCLPPI